MSNPRFNVGTLVMCNLGPNGWKLGRIIALDYREDDWPIEKDAPYEVLLNDNHTLIYVPEDNSRYCREATNEDLKIAHRMDALDVLPSEVNMIRSKFNEESNNFDSSNKSLIGCEQGEAKQGSPGYRTGRCYCCHYYPKNWSYAELYSEHYRCVVRNGIRITRQTVNLGKISVGEQIKHQPGQDLLSKDGFMQAPTLVRLPPGIRFFDDGSLEGKIQFDPHRKTEYRVEFVAVSTSDWNDPNIGIVRYEITFSVEGNEPPDDFEVSAFAKKQEDARFSANNMLQYLRETWDKWDRRELSNRDTCNQMKKILITMRDLLEKNPRLDSGKWWAQLGGFHMNVHKLLENTLFECELYLGYALTFGDSEVRRMAEQNLEGCYNKRLLEAARFMWIDGIKQMMRGEWSIAAEIFHLASIKKNGWGWAVNYGDIWISESVSRIIQGVEIAISKGSKDEHSKKFIIDAEKLLKKGISRAEETPVFGNEGHPWASEITSFLTSYHTIKESTTDLVKWLKEFKSRTVYWCAQVLGGAPPFPPKPRVRLEDSEVLISRLPGHINHFQGN